MKKNYLSILYSIILLIIIGVDLFYKIVEFVDKMTSQLIWCSTNDAK